MSSDASEFRPALGRWPGSLAALAATADARALAVLTALTTLAAWNRLQFDSWLARFDILTFYLPWYAFLGERLRVFDVPGWNPHLFSGTPFAADPQSGWMYLPAMLAFPFWNALTAYKVMVVLQLIIAAVPMYAYGRVLGFGAFAALISTVVLLFGPFLQWNTDCCAVMGQYLAWVPLTLLGVELALRARSWGTRLVPWSLAAIGVSQMFGGWVGEGWLDAGLLIGSYIAFRALISPPRVIAAWRERFVLGATTGAATFGLGLALGAAGILPRLAINAETNLAGGDYERLGVPTVDNPPWELPHLFGQILGSGYDRRATTIGGAAIVLTLLALPLARRRFAVPYFAALTAVCLILTLDTTPLHELFYLIPRFRVIHEHDPWRIMAIAVIGPPVLSGAAVESLLSWRGRRRSLPLLVVPVALLGLAAALLPDSERFLGWSPLLAGIAATGAVLIIVAWGGREASRPRLKTVAMALIFVAAIVQPLGTELTGSWFGWPGDSRWERRWHPAANVMPALTTEASRTDPDGAGAFLAAELERSGPFRYLGYGGAGYPAERPRVVSYMATRLQPNIQAILANGRPMFLGLYDAQGYNPIQLDRYLDLINAINAAPQDYHTAYLLGSGAQSRLLALLDLRYIVLDASLPADRADVLAITAGRREVFRTDQVIVYATDAPLPHAWIVHDVQQVAKDEALPLLADGSIDPRKTALIEGAPPAVEASLAPANESAQVTRYEPDRVSVEVTANAAGLLVISEVFAAGWQATVNGRAVDVVPTNHVLRGVPVEPGVSTVEFRYKPRSLTAGLWISIGATLLVLGLWAERGWRASRRPVRRAVLSRAMS